MAQGQIIYNDLSVQGALAMRDDITWGTGSASATKQLILATTGTDVGLDIQTQGTGIIRVPTGYEANILSDSRAVTNRAYTDAHIAGKNLDATVTAPGAPQNNQAILWNQAGTKFTMGTVALGRVFRDGLTDDGTNVSLGGVTTVNVPNVVNAIAGSMFFQANFGSGASPSGFKAQAVSAGVNNAQMFAGIAALDMTNTSMIVTANFSGAMQYAVDYSANYTARTLTDLGYFQSHLVAKPTSALLVAPTGSEDGYVVYWNNVSGKFDLKAGASVGSIPDQTILGNISGALAGPSALNGAQVNTVLPVFTSLLKGLTPASGGGTTTFLRADGTWATVAGGVTSVTGTANQITASPTTGAVVLTLPSNVAFPGTWTEGTLGYSDTGILWSAQSSVAGYNQVIVQNTNSGSTASVNYLVSNNSGTASTFFGEFGMNSSGFTGSGSWNIASAVYLDSVSSDLAIGTLGNNSIHFFTNSGTTDRLSIDGSGNITFTQAAQSSSWSNAILFTPGAHTSHTASTEFIDYDFALNRNVQWLAGTVATQRQVYVRGVTLTGASATATFTTAYTLYVDPPIAGTNAVITTPFAAYFGGKVQFTPTATLAALNIGTAGASDPSTTVNFDIWGITNSLRAKINSSVVTIPYAISISNNRIAMFNGTSGRLDSSPFQATSATGTGQVVQTNGTAIFQFIDANLTSIPTTSEFVTAAFGGLTGDALNAASTSTAQWAAGTVTTQRFNYFKGRTLTGVSATAVFTNAYTLYVDAPTAGTNASITNNWAAGFNGNVLVNGASGSNNLFRVQNGGVDIYNFQANVALWTKSVNTFFGLTITNSTSGTASYAYTQLQSSTANLTMIAYSATFTTSGMSVQNTSVVTSSAGAGINIGTSNAAQVSLWTNNTQKLLVDSNGLFVFTQASQSVSNTFQTFTQSAHTGGTTNGLLWTAGAHTGATAIELIDWNINLARTVQFTGSTGFATQRAFLIQAPTYAFVSATGIITNAYTFYITGSPVVGTNAAITNSFTAGFGGRVQFNQTTTTSPIQIVGFTSDPSVPVEGEISYNTTSHLLKFYNGTSWTSAGGGTGWAVTGATTITGNTNQTGSFKNTFNLDQVIITQNTLSGTGLGAAFIINGAAHTNMTASESIHVAVNLNQTVQFTGSTGFATQRAVLIQAPTYAFASATGTITDAASCAIVSAPILGTNAAITNTHGLLIQSAAVGAATNSFGITANAMTGATNNYSAQFLGGLGVKLNHLIGSTSAPGIAAGTGAGTTPTVSIVGNDLDGVISIVTGTGSPAATAIIATITFTATYGVAPKIVIYPANRAARDLAIGAWPIVPAAGQTNGVTTTTFVLESGTALATTTTYLWHYHIIQ